MDSFEWFKKMLNMKYGDPTASLHLPLIFVLLAFDSSSSPQFVINRY